VAQQPAGCEDVYVAYREAIRRRVCAICLDGRDDGQGRLTTRTCALDEHLARLVDTIRDVRGGGGEAFAAAVEARVCSHCSDRDELGRCALRKDGRCGLAVYLPLVVEAVAEVDGA